MASLNISLSIGQSIFQYINAENSSTIFRGAHISISLLSSTSLNYSFPSGLTPYDGTPLKKIHHHPIQLITVYYILATAGLVFVAVCFLFNVIFRKKRYVYEVVIHDNRCNIVYYFFYFLLLLLILFCWIVPLCVIELLD